MASEKGKEVDIEKGHEKHFIGFDGLEIPQSSFWAQFGALMKKSALNQWRQYKTNACQIIFPLALIILLFLLQLLVNSFIADRGNTSIPAQIHPPTAPFPLIETNMTAPDDCPPFTYELLTNPTFILEPTEFHYVGNQPDVEQLLNLTNTKGLVMIKGVTFPDRGNLQDFCNTRYYLANPVTWKQVESKEVLNEMVYTGWKGEDIHGGFIFNQLDKQNHVLDVSISYNETLTRGNDIPVLLQMLGNAFLKLVNPNATEFVLLGKKGFPSKEAEITFDLISLIGPYLYIYVFQLTFPVILGSIVYEKERKLDVIMVMMGLKMNTYWLVTYIFSFLLYFVAFLILWAAAAIFQFRFFTINDGGAIFLLFFFYGHCQVSFSFLMSVFFNKSRTATVVGYILVFITGLLAGQVITEYFRSSDTPEALVFILTIIPQFALYRGLIVLSNAVSFDGPGLSMDKVWEKRMGEVWLFLIVEWFLFLVLAIYLQAVLKTGYGVKKHPLFFLQKSFWTGEPVIETSTLKETSPGEPEDVAEVRKSMFNKDNNYYLRIEDLHKVYPGENGLADKVAVKNLTLGVKYGECFGFLGPNGAGKTTSINILCGLYRATSGTAVIDGMDIRDNIDSIHMLMGVCPQDNILWDDLTGPEHLEFYGRIKNMKGKELKDAIFEGLKAVNLHEETRKKSREYSGGMKRRLSVACSLMGNPRIILMDEPSTGLDPASRRQLWELINTQKRKCALLLTTHAMEEADALCDRLGIFADGELKCVGTSTSLKKRFGKGYKLTVHSEAKYESEARKFVLEVAPEAVLLNSLAGTSNYEVPKSSIHLSKIFTIFEENREKYHIKDWGISNTTLEEVFLKIYEASEKHKKTETKPSTKKGKVDEIELQDVEAPKKNGSSSQASSSKTTSKESESENEKKSEEKKSKSESESESEKKSKSESKSESESESSKKDKKASSSEESSSSDEKKKSKSSSSSGSSSEDN